MASALTPYLATISLGREPLFTPMRMGTPLSEAAFTTASTLAREPMLPGLMRSPEIPASRACKASLWSKWMSATRGTLAFSAKTGIARISSAPVTAKRMIWQPACSKEAVWARAASKSRVGTLSMLWIETGAPPPIWTLPKCICRVGLRVIFCMWQKESGRVFCQYN